MIDDIEKNKASSGCRKAERALDQAERELRAVPPPTTGERKNVTARRVRAKKRVEVAHREVARACRNQFDRNIGPAEAPLKPKEVL